MTPKPLTPDLARAIARDRANARMRAAGREQWDEGDQKLYDELVAALMPEEPKEQTR